MTDAKKDTDQETSARRIIDRLKMFNRKERDHLMKFALCEEPETPIISEKLWAFISRNDRRERPHADSIFVGMDYHLNWLYAALATAHIEDDNSIKNLDNDWKHSCGPDKKNKNFRPLQDNQEDIDLLVAWIGPHSRLQLVLIEAKLDSGWITDQIERKLERISLIRKDAIERSMEFIDWRLLLMSPNQPSTRSKKIRTLLTDKRHAWAMDHDGEEPKFWHRPWTLPSGRAAVNRVSGNWGYWAISSRN